MLLKSEELAKTNKLYEMTSKERASINPPVYNVHLSSEIKAGAFLVAHPIIQNSPFSRAVILITEYSPATGATGLVVNVPITKKRKSDNSPHQVKLSQVIIPDMSSYMFSNLKNAPVRTGGPIDHSFTMLIKNEVGKDIKGSIAINENIMVGGDIETLNDIIGKHEEKLNDVIFFNGVSTWTQNQLENELERGTWFMVNANTEWLFNANMKKEQVWNQVMAELQGEYATFQNFPSRLRFDDDEDEDDRNEEDEE